jgi:hypothetical protein
VERPRLFDGVLGDDPERHGRYRTEHTFVSSSATMVAPSGGRLSCMVFALRVIPALSHARG